MSLPIRGRTARFESNGASRITKIACGLLLSAGWCLGSTTPALAQSIAGGIDDGFSAFADNGAAIASPDIAVGPGILVAAVSGEIAWYDKQQTFLGKTELSGPDGLWTELGASANIQTPQVVWNQAGNCFYAAAAEDMADGHEVIFTAFTNTADPSDGWSAQRTYVTSIGSKVHNLSLGNYGDGIFFTFDFDPELQNLGCWMGAASKERLEDPSLGVVNFSKLSSIPRGFVCNEASGVGTPDLISVTINSGAFQTIWMTGLIPGGYMASNWLSLPWRVDPPMVEHSGPSIDIGNREFSSCKIAGNSLWTAHSVSAGDRSAVQWYEIDLRSWPASGPKPILKQQGLIDLGPGVHAFMPDIAADVDGNAVIVFNVASEGENIAIARAVRFSDDPVGEFQDPVVIRSSVTNNTSGLWGAYVGVEADPTDAGVFWSHAPYHEGGWKTWIGKVTLDNVGEPEGPYLRNPNLGDLRGTISTFNWDPYSLAISYRLTISLDPSFEGVVYDSGDIFGTEHEVAAGILSCNTKYYWRVEAVTPHETMQSPETRWFRIMMSEDINVDGIVDSADLGLLLSVYGSAEPAADFNSDGRVDAADIGMLIGAFGDTCN